LTDIFVLPSAYREGVPRVLLEAASMQLPIITTNSPGCNEVVIHGENGFHIPLRDPIALSHAIILLLEQPDLRQQFGRLSRQRAVDHFDLSVVTAQTRSVYWDLLARKVPLFGWEG
jgi:glycosyltransferase involved in cell wall biosynthesis